MYKHILIATDDSGKAVAAGLALAKELKSSGLPLPPGEPALAHRGG
jgi:hypothetical protein